MLDPFDGLHYALTGVKASDIPHDSTSIWTMGKGDFDYLHVIVGYDKVPETGLPTEAWPYLFLEANKHSWNRERQFNAPSTIDMELGVKIYKRGSLLGDGTDKGTIKIIKDLFTFLTNRVNQTLPINGVNHAVHLNSLEATFSAIADNTKPGQERIIARTASITGIWEGCAP